MLEKEYTNYHRGIKMKLNKDNHEIEFLYISRTGKYINFGLDNINLKTESYN